MSFEEGTGRDERGSGEGGCNRDSRQSGEEGGEEMKGKVWRLDEKEIEGESGRDDVVGMERRIRRERHKN